MTTLRASLPFLAILLVGTALRVLAFSTFAIHHPDEAIQYIEQAHRLVFGTGIVPWEYRFGMRSWAVPLLLAGPMWIGKAVAPGMLLYVVLPRAVSAVLASTAIIAAWGIGSRVSPRHGLIAMAAIALWYESVYFSVHVLTESLAVAAFLSAAAVLAPGGPRGRLVAGGALLMLAVVLRVHYSPAVGAYALVLFGRRWRDWRWLALGGAAVAVASGTVDVAMGQWPFGWMVANFYQNIVAGKASAFGDYGPEAYPEMLWLHWQVAAVPILWLAARAARRFPALATAALVNLVVHLAIGHKEYRFILLTGQIAIVLAAIGTADLVERADRAWLSRLTVAAVAAWALAALLLAFSPLGDPGWRSYEGGFRLARQAQLQGVCGMALVAGSSWAAGGQTYLHHAPLYAMIARRRAEEDRELAATTYAYDAIISTSDRPAPAPYRRIGCGGEGTERLCLAVRPGGCRRDARSDALLMQRVMERLGR